MNAPSEQWIVGELRRAASRYPLPPESGWVPERRSTSRGWTTAMALATVIFAVAVVAAVNAQLESRLVPSMDPFVVVEDAEWARVRSGIPADVVVLRPAWIPPQFHDPTTCPFQPSVLGTVDRLRYTVRYFGRPLASGLCEFLDFTEVPDVRSYTGYPDNLVDFGPLYGVRESVVWVRSGTTGASRDLKYYGESEQLTYIWWNEGGRTYEVGGVNVSIGDLVRVLMELEVAR
jgi:hypothetical protein